MEVQPIPWIKKDDMEWEHGNIYLAARSSSAVLYSFPVLVYDFGNGFVETISSSPRKVDVNEFTHYAIITEPKE